MYVDKWVVVFFCLVFCFKIPLFVVSPPANTLRCIWMSFGIICFCTDTTPSRPINSTDCGSKHALSRENDLLCENDWLSLEYLKIFPFWCQASIGVRSPLRIICCVLGDDDSGQIRESLPEGWPFIAEASAEKTSPVSQLDNLIFIRVLGVQKEISKICLNFPTPLVQLYHLD